jgi:D-alanyl-D-alanine carboxypeptidase (penicillin-binding protein 5/6)
LRLRSDAARLAVLALLAVLVWGAPQAAAQEPATEAEVPEPPAVEARAWALADADSGLLLAGEAADERLPPASTVKVMAALVVLEEAEDLDEEVVVSAQAERFVGTVYSNVGLIQGERVTVRDLLLATLVPSGTEAVYALAEHFGAGSVERFVEKMNEKADSMGLQNTGFADPAGLDDPGNYSSARDLAAIAREALRYPLFAELVGMTEATVSTDTREIEVFTTNGLLYAYPPATGVKTGTSPEAGPSLVASAGAEDERYIAVVLAASDDLERFRAAEELLRHAFDRYEREVLVEEGAVYEERPLPYRRDESVELISAGSVAGPVDAASEVELRTTAGELPESAQAGEELGEVEVFIEGRRVGATPLVAREGYEEASIFDRVWFWITGLFE